MILAQLSFSSPPVWQTSYNQVIPIDFEVIDAFRRYKDATKATKDKYTGLLKISNDQYANLQTLNFIIDGNTYPLIPNAQIWPRSLNYAINGDSDSIYLVISDIGSECGSGLDFINGYAFLSVFAVTSFISVRLTIYFTVNDITLSTTLQTSEWASHRPGILLMLTSTK